MINGILIQTCLMAFVIVILYNYGEDNIWGRVLGLFWVIAGVSIFIAIFNCYVSKKYGENYTAAHASA